MSTASPASAPAPPSRLRIGSISYVPIEIKSMIVDNIAQESTTLVERLQTMRAMSLVSREFLALTEPYLWSHVSLGSIPTRHLAHFLASVLPRHAPHITHLNLPHFDHTGAKPSSAGDDSELGEGDNADSAEAEAILGRPVAAMNDPVFALHLSFLLMRAIRRMRKLSAVRSVLSHFSHAFCPPRVFVEGEKGNLPSMGRRIQARPGDCSAARHRSVAGALAALGPRLQELEIVGDDEAWDGEGGLLYTDGRLAAFLANFPSLSRLALNARLSSDVPTAGQHSLVTTLGSFRHLTSLELTCRGRLSNRFPSAAWACPLEALFLTELETLSIPTLSRFFANFSATLKSLVIYESPSERLELEYDYPINPFPLPHLETVEFSTPTLPDDILLEGFAISPIRYLILHATPSETPTRWHDFIQSHLDTLQRVTINVGASRDDWTLNLVDAVRDLCNAGAVECVVEEGRAVGMDDGEDSDTASESGAESSEWDSASVNSDSESDSEEESGQEWEDETD